MAVGSGIGGLAGFASGSPILGIGIQIVNRTKGPVSQINSSFARLGKRVHLTEKQMWGMNFAMSSMKRMMATLSITMGILGKVTADFERNIASMAAILGESAVSNIDILRNAAIDLSKEFPVSATKVAEGMRVLAQAGLSMNSIMQSTPAILSLSQSTLESFETSAKLVVKTVSSMGLEFAQTGKVANSLQFAVNQSINTLETLNNALKFSAPFAKQLGIELDDLLSVLMLTANAGIEAGIAGRSLGQALQQVAKGGQKNASDQAQVLVGEVRNLIDSGQDMSHIAQLLTERLGGLSEEEMKTAENMEDWSDSMVDAAESGEAVLGVTERLSRLIEVFGVRGARVFALLMGDDQISQMRKFRMAMELELIDAATQAQVAMDNLASQSQLAFNQLTAPVFKGDIARNISKQVEDMIGRGVFTDMGEELNRLGENMTTSLIPAAVQLMETFTKLVSVGVGPFSAAIKVTSILLSHMAVVVETLASIADIPILGDVLVGGIALLFAFEKAMGVMTIAATSGLGALRRLGLAQEAVATTVLKTNKAVASSGVPYSQHARLTAGVAQQNKIMVITLDRMIAMFRLMATAMMNLGVVTEKQATITQQLLLEDRLLFNQSGTLIGRLEAETLAWERNNAARLRNSNITAKQFVENSVLMSTVNASRGPISPIQGEKSFKGAGKGFAGMAGIGLAASAFHAGQGGFNDDVSGSGRISGMAFGAIEGAMVGSMVPVIGTALGAVLGAATPLLAEGLGKLVKSVKDGATSIEDVMNDAKDKMASAMETGGNTVEDVISNAMAIAKQSNFGANDVAEARQLARPYLDEILTSMAATTDDRFTFENGALLVRTVTPDEKLETGTTASGEAFVKLDPSMMELIGNPTVRGDFSMKELNLMTSKGSGFASEFDIDTTKMARDFDKVTQNAEQLGLEFFTSASGAPQLRDDMGNVFAPTLEFIQALDQLDAAELDAYVSKLSEIGGVAVSEYGRLIVDGLERELQAEFRRSFDVVPTGLSDEARQQFALNNVSALFGDVDPTLMKAAFHSTFDTGVNVSIGEGTLDSDGNLGVPAQFSERQANAMEQVMAMSESAMSSLPTLSKGLADEIKELQGEANKLMRSMAELRKEAVQKARDVIKATVAEIATSAGFVANHANELGLSGEEFSNIQARITKAALFNEAATVMEAQEKFKLAKIEQSITQGKLAAASAILSQTNQELNEKRNLLKTYALQSVVGYAIVDADKTLLDSAQALAESQVAAAEANVAMAKAAYDSIDPSGIMGGVFLASASAAIRAAQVSVADAKKRKDAVDKITGSYEATAKEQAEATKRFNELNTTAEDLDSQIMNYISQMTAAANTMAATNGNMERLQEALGLTADDMAGLDVVGLVETIQENMVNGRRLSELIGGITNNAPALGEALALSADTLTSLGYSTAQVQEVMDTFGRVQLLNSILGFMNNFQGLANTFGDSLNLTGQIQALQTEIFFLGSKFLDDLLGVADARTLSEIFARQNYVNQNVNNRIRVSLQAEINFPEGIAAEDREEITQIALESVSEAVAKAVAENRL